MAQSGDGHLRKIFILLQVTLVDVKNYFPIFLEAFE